MLNRLGSIAALSGKNGVDIYKVSEQYGSNIPDFVARRILRVFDSPDVVKRANNEFKRVVASRKTTASAASSSTAAGKQPVRK